MKIATIEQTKQTILIFRDETYLKNIVPATIGTRHPTREKKILQPMLVSGYGYKFAYMHHFFAMLPMFSICDGFTLF